MLDIKYIAGFFDGEGCVQIYKIHNKNSYAFTIAISQTDCDESRFILNELLTAYGGCIVKCRRYGNQKKWMQYKLSSRKALKFLTEIYEYSIVKKSQIKLALDFYNNSFIDKEILVHTLKMLKG